MCSDAWGGFLREEEVSQMDDGLANADDAHISAEYRFFVTKAESACMMILSDGGGEESDFQVVH